MASGLLKFLQERARSRMFAGIVGWAELVKPNLQPYISHEPTKRYSADLRSLAEDIDGELMFFFLMTV